MAEAFLAREGGRAIRVTSAGTHPTTVNPLTVRALADHGIDWTGARAKSMIDYLDQRFDVVVTVCDEAAEACPVFPGGGRRVHANFPDPASAMGTEEERLATFRRVCDEIEVWAQEFVRLEVADLQR